MTGEKSTSGTGSGPKRRPAQSSRTGSHGTGAKGAPATSKREPGRAGSQPSDKAEERPARDYLPARRVWPD